MPRQDGRKRLQTCPGCGQAKRDVESVSARILPPSGGRLCGDCLHLEIRFPTRARLE